MLLLLQLLMLLLLLMVVMLTRVRVMGDGGEGDDAIMTMPVRRLSSCGWRPTWRASKSFRRSWSGSRWNARRCSRRTALHLMRGR